MANDIVLGAAMRQNLLSLQNTQKNIDVTQLRLATGKKVNSALDNPQSFFQAQSLNNRASDLTRLLDGIGQSIRTIEEADKGVTALSNLINQATSVAESAEAELRASEGFVSVTGTKDLRGKDLVADSGGAVLANDEFRITIKDDDINSGTAVSSSDIVIATGDTVYDVVAAINSDANIQDYVRASVDSQGRLKIESLEEGAVLRIDGTGTPADGPTAAGWAYLGLDNVVGAETANAALSQGGTLISGRTLSSAVSNGTQVDGKYQASDTFQTAGYIADTEAATFEITIDGETGTRYTLDDDETIQSLIDKINNDTNVNEKVTASFNVDTGTIDLKFGDNVGTANLRIGVGNDGDIPAFGFGTGATDGAITTAASGSRTEKFTFVGSSVNLDQYTKDFNKLRAQIDGIVKDANYRGVNLLGGDTLTTFFNEDRTSSLDTEGQDLTAVGLGIDEADFIDAASVQEGLDQVRAALETVRAFGTSIANDLSIIQTREDFTNQTISTLKAGASDLTDADLNEEGANLLALQTAQQLGVTSLSLASQSQQSVLRLF